MSRVTFRDYPIKSPCEICGEEKWRECLSIPLACDELWEYLANRGDWVMEQNKFLDSDVDEVS